jgi:hypothetical protein
MTGPAYAGPADSSLESQLQNLKRRPAVVAMLVLLT